MPKAGLLTFICFLLITLAACQSPRPLVMPATLPAVAGSTETWMRTELYFGLTRRDGSLIPESDWRAFVAAAITPAFPDGFTILRAQGQYLDEKKVLHSEPSRLVILLHPQGGEADAKINRIIAAYLQIFDQESVLRADSPESVSFVHQAAGR